MKNATIDNLIDIHDEIQVLKSKRNFCSLESCQQCHVKLTLSVSKGISENTVKNMGRKKKSAINID